MTTITRRSLLAATGFAAIAIHAPALGQGGTPGPGTSAVPLYRIDLGTGLPPTAQVVVGVVFNRMMANTTVAYPAGGSAESLVIDYVLAGEYQAQSPETMRIVRADGASADVSGGEAVTIAAGDALVIIQNEAEVTIAAGPSNTETLSVGLFTLQQGTGAFDVDGSLESDFLGAGPPLTLPDGGVTALLYEGDIDATLHPEALVTLPVASGSASWTVVLLPIEASATPPAQASPAA